MGEKMDLPDNYQRHVRLGKLAANQQQWAAAITHFEAAYQLEQRFSLNLLLASVLVENHQLKAALAIMQEKEADYLAYHDLTGFYIAVLLANHCFVEANHLWQANWPQMQKDPQQRQFWQTVKQSIERGQLQYQKQAATKIKTVQQALYSLADKTLTEQMQILNQAKQLPQTAYLTGVMPVLVNPYVHPFVKSTVLEELVRLQVEKPVPVNWFTQTRTVVPQTLPTLAENPTIQAVSQAVQQALVAEPVLAEQIGETVQLYLACLYPFETEVVKDISEWANLFLTELGLPVTKGHAEISENARHWFHQLQEIVNELMV